MTESIPAGARPVSRVILLDETNRLFLLHALDPVGKDSWWVTPGGGLERGETFIDAAARELREETGLEVEIGPCVWVRRHAYQWSGRVCDQYERFFVARTTRTDIIPEIEDAYVMRRRWWTIDELASSSEVFAPRRLPQLIAPIATGEHPWSPIDCGI